MNEQPTVPAAEREDLLRRGWYSHDARWFAAVAAEFGLEAANRLNRGIVREIGRVEAKRLAGALGLAGAANLDEFLRFLEAGAGLYVAPPLMEMDVEPLDDRSYAIRFRRCFVAENIARAGIAEAYECAVFERVQGWHDARGLPLAETTLPARTCPVASGGECRRRLEVAG